METFQWEHCPQTQEEPGDLITGLHEDPWNGDLLSVLLPFESNCIRSSPQIYGLEIT